MPGIDSFTKLIIHANSDFTDSSDSNHTPTVTGATIDTGTKQFGAGSGKFVASSSQRVTYPDHADWNFGTGEFTIDLWVNFTTTSGDQMLVTNGDYIAGGAWLFWFEGGATSLNFHMRPSGVSTGTLLIAASWTPSTSTWYHLMLSKDSSDDYRLFVDGTQIGSTANNTTALLDSTEKTFFGAQRFNGTVISFLDGFLDEVRISKGVARETSNFTPETSEYTRDVTPATLTLTAAALAPTIIVPDATITPSALAITAAVLAPTVVQDVTTTPSVLTITAALPASTVDIGVTVSVSSLALTATFETPFVTFSANAGILNQDLPRLTLASSATIGWTLNKDLPKLQIDATMTSGSLLRLNKNLPKLTIDAKGAGIASNNLPRLLIDATMQVGSRARLNRRLPRLVIDASGTVGRNGQLNKDLPRLVIDATLVSGNFVTLNKNLPRLILQARGFQGVAMTLNKNLPKLTLDATGFFDQGGTLNKDLLKLTIDAYGDSYSNRYI